MVKKGKLMDKNTVYLQNLALIPFSSLVLQLLLMALTQSQRASGAHHSPTILEANPNLQYHIQTDQGPERFFRFQTLSGQFRLVICCILLPL